MKRGKALYLGFLFVFGVLFLVTGVLGQVVGEEAISRQFHLGDKAINLFPEPITIDELPELLADGVFANTQDNRYNYVQEIRLIDWGLEHFADNRYKDREPTIGFGLESRTPMLVYTLDFAENPPVDTLKSFDSLDILGKEYILWDVRKTSQIEGMAFILLEGEKAILEEGDVWEEVIGDETYRVVINFIDSSSVRLNVNGEFTNALNEGESQRLSDGSYVIIRNIEFMDVIGAENSVEFTIYRNEIELRNNRLIEVNDDVVPEIRSYIVFANNNLDKIILGWETADREFITAESDLKMPVFDLMISMFEMNFPAKENIIVESDGGSSVQLSTPIKDGEARLNFLYDDADEQGRRDGKFDGIGESSDQQLATSDFPEQLTYINIFSGRDVHDKFVASWTDGREAESYLLDVSRVGEREGRNAVDIRNDVTFEDICVNKAVGDSCFIGNIRLEILEIVNEPLEESVKFRINDGGNFNKLYTKEGLTIHLPYETGKVVIPNNADNYGAVNFKDANAPEGHNSDRFYLYMTEEDEEGNIGRGETFKLVIDDNGLRELEVSDVDSGSFLHRIDDGSNYETYVVSPLATKIAYMRPTDLLRSAEIEYHGGESTADVILSGDVSTAGRERFIRGDADGNGNVNLNDAVYVLRYLFQGGGSPECLKAADVNDDGVVNMADAVYLLNHLFAGGRAPPAPYPNLGVDDTADKLSCGG